MYGGILWGAYNMGYLWPAVPIGWYSMVYLKKRYLALWSKVCSPPYSSQLRRRTDCNNSITTLYRRRSHALLLLVLLLSSLRCSGVRLRLSGGVMMLFRRVVRGRLVRG